MIVKVAFDGIKEYVSSKGNPYADIFARSISLDGKADFEQVKFRTFNDEVIKSCRSFSKDDILDLDLTIRDATVEGVL